MPETQKRSKSSSKTGESHHHRSSKSAVSSEKPEQQLNEANEVTGSSSEITCENCKTQRPVFYCAECDLLLCQQCSQEIHTQPAFAEHQVQPESAQYVNRATCKQHSQRAFSYCQTCNEFLCQKCIEIAHTGVKHVIVNSETAFAQKIGQIREEISGNLLPLRENLQHLFDQYTALREQLEQKEQQIEHYTRQQTDCIVQKLSSAAAAKLGVVNPDFQYLAEVIDKIDYLEQVIEQFEMGSRNQLEIFDNYNNYLEIIKTAKALNEQELKEQLLRINFELPEEMQKMQQYYNEYGNNKSLIEAKNQQIELLNSQISKIQENALEEMQKWENLVANYAEELKTSSMECVFCGEKCEPGNINQECSYNQCLECSTSEATERAEKIVEKEESLIIHDAMQFVGTGRHYFVKSFK